jgi:uncharacterized protein
VSDRASGARRGLAPADETARVGLAGANSYGIGFAVGGFAAGVVCASIATTLYASASGTKVTANNFGGNIADLAGLWVGLLGAVLLAERSRAALDRGNWRAELARQFGLSVRLWPDLPLGIVVGVAAQFVLAPLLELPLVPFVPHLFHRLGEPAHTLTVHVHGAGLVLLGVLICAGSPLVEELFFRGLLLRALMGAIRKRSPRLAVPAGVVLTGVLFGLAHFEALQLIAPAGFGIVLGALATRTGRLGPGIVAHAAFNAVTFISLAMIRP